MEIVLDRLVQQYDSGSGEISHMRVLAFGHVLFAVGLAGIGVLSIASRDFAYTWQPVPEWVGGRAFLAVVSGLLLVGAGLGILVKRTARTSTLVMTIYLATWVLVLQSPRVMRAPANVGSWLGFCENLILVCGGWTLFLSLNRNRNAQWPKIALDTIIPRFLFGASCIVLALSHFVYADATASMVPAWLPDRVFFAYFTGSAHLAAGLAILLGAAPRLAATLEAVMISSFVLMVHAPGVAAAPGSRLQWTMLFVASALAGSAWVVAGCLQASSWGWRRRSLTRVAEAANAEQGS